MSWAFHNNLPIYVQIISSQLQAEEKLPAVRELAAEARVNPNAIQRALSDLEQEEFVYSQRTAGRFVTNVMAWFRNLDKNCLKRIWNRNWELLAYSVQMDLERQRWLNSAMSCSSQMMEKFSSMDSNHHQKLKKCILFTRYDLPKWKHENRRCIAVF